MHIKERELGLKGKARDRNHDGAFSSVEISDELVRHAGSSQIEREEQEGASQ
jgi:hypothetical protein